MDELAGCPRDQLRLLAILDLTDARPEIGRAGEGSPDQVGVGRPVDVRLVRGIQREPEAASHVRLAHPEQRQRHPDVGVDARER